MKASEFLSILADYALRGATDDERVHVFDAIAEAPQHVARHCGLEDGEKVHELAVNARAAAAAIRAADAAQLQFRNLIDAKEEP